MRCHSSATIVYPYFINKNLILSHQSGFTEGDSWINLLLSITHEIYKSLDEGFGVRGVFLDISNAFDRVWHNVLTFRLKIWHFWYITAGFKSCFKIQKTVSGFKWPTFILGRCKCAFSPRSDSGKPPFSSLY